MPVKYIPYVPNTIEGQAILDNITRTRRVLRYRDNDRVYDRIRRGLPLYETDKIERVGGVSENLLIRGECLSACAYLKDNGIAVDLVYIDPPFASGADYAKKVYLRRHPQKAREIDKHEEAIQDAIENGDGIDFDELRAFEEKMYGDIWKKGDYLNWMYENLTAIKSVMSEMGAIYAHLDWHVGHYVKVMMDEIFGEHNFRNEIVWYYYNKLQGNVNRFASNHDVVFWYSMSDEYVFSQQRDEREEPTTQIKRVWDKGKGRLVNAKDEMGKVIYQEATHRTVDDVWRLSMLQPADKTEKLDYGGTQKPESVLNRIIEASSKEGMVVADFFGGSGTTARAAHKLGRSFIHVDVGVNSIQTTRDELMRFGAQFDIVDVKDGVSLFRNPVQTMDKLKTLITGLKNEDSLDKFWEGAINDSKLGMVPVYLPNLLDHTTKVLDIPLMNRVLREALPDLPEGVKQAIVYYVDIDDRKAVLDFIKENNPTDIKVELRDLKEVLDEVVLNDEVDYKSRKTKRGYEVEIKRFNSDRLQQKIDEYNQKKELREKAPLFVQDENGESDDEEESKKRTKFKPIEISDDGLELIELVSLDCTKAKGAWHSDAEIKVDKKGFVIRDGKKTKEFWDAKISSPKKPLRLKVRNIAGDESILTLIN